MAKGKFNAWKLVGLLATVVGAGLSILSGIVEDKKMEEAVDKKVDEAFAKRLGES